MKDNKESDSESMQAKNIKEKKKAILAKERLRIKTSRAKMTPEQ